MPAKNPRINVVLDETMYKNVQYLAETDGVSLSTKVRDVIREALEIQEDIYLAAFAESRENTWDKSTTLNHEKTWS